MTDKRYRPVVVAGECAWCGEEFCPEECRKDEHHEAEECSCRLCFCMNETDSGEVCGQCLAGPHQG